MAQHWLEELDPAPAADREVDGAGYIDAATVALRRARLSASTGVGAPAEQAVTPRSLRDVMGSMATGVCVVTTRTDEHDLAMTANSVTSVSLDPPLVLVCVARTARFHGAVLGAGVWGVSILDATSWDVSTHFARPGRTPVGQLAALPHHRGGATGVALLDGSVASLECETTHVYPGGDHDIIVGRVVALARDGESRHPLLFHRGGYRWLL